MSGEILFTRPDLRRRGFDRPERELDLRRVRRNVWAAGTAASGPTAEYRLWVQAAHRSLTGDHVFSHESAAVLLGLPALREWPRAIHLLSERKSGGRSQLDVVRHCLGLEDVPMLSIDGMLLTTAGRTAFDLALTRPFDEAVVVADAAFRLYPDARAEFAVQLDAWGHRRGYQAATAVLLFADGRSGSVGESLSRVEIERCGFATPELQVRVVTGAREEYGDFGWLESRSLGEFDGEVKYRDDRYRGGGSAEDVVIREKNRENRMRVTWPNIARWDWADLHSDRFEGILIAAQVPKRRGPSRFARWLRPPRGR